MCFLLKNLISCCSSGFILLLMPGLRVLEQQIQMLTQALMVLPQPCTPALSAYSITAALRTRMRTKSSEIPVAITHELFLTVITDRKRWRDCYNVALIFFFFQLVRFLYLLVE